MVSPDVRVCPEVVARDVAALSAVVLTWRSRGRTPELGTRVGAFISDARGVTYARIALNEGGWRRNDARDKVFRVALFLPSQSLGPLPFSIPEKQSAAS